MNGVIPAVSAWPTARPTGRLTSTPTATCAEWTELHTNLCPSCLSSVAVGEDRV